MKAIYNSRILPLEKISLDIHNRAFCYGDGLFETIVAGPDRINLTEYHFNRLFRASTLLDIQIPFDLKLLSQMMDNLKKENHISENCRFRLQVWRDSGGLYSPEKRNASFLLTADKTERPFYGEVKNLSVSTTSRVVHHQLSFAKTMSALPYVLAGLEKRDSPYDDLIILDGAGNVAETISSNLFWIKDGVFYTPSLNTGCVAGTLRAYLLDTLSGHGHTVQELMTGLDTVIQADSIFTTNASGVNWVTTYEGRQHYKAQAEMIALLF